MRIPSSGRVRLAALAVIVLGVAAGGIAYASIPDASGTIHGCYGIAGVLRVIDAEAGASCRTGETEVSWNQTGPPGQDGQQGPAGTAGPTVLVEGISHPIVQPFIPPPLASYTVTADQAGLNIITATFEVKDQDGTTGGVTAVGCSININGSGLFTNVVVSDNGDVFKGDTDVATALRRSVLNTGDVVTAECVTSQDVGDANEARGRADLLLERVAS